jgi:hypothetical protein
VASDHLFEAEPRWGAEAPGKQEEASEKYWIIDGWKRGERCKAKGIIIPA